MEGEDLETLLRRRGALPPGFDAWFARCVHRAIDQRYPDAGAAIDALRPVLLGTAAPGFAPPPAVGTTMPMASAPTPPPTPATADAWTVERSSTRRSRTPLVAAVAVGALVGTVAVALYLRAPTTPTGAAYAAAEAVAPQVPAVTPPPAPPPTPTQAPTPAPQPAPAPVAEPARQPAETPRVRPAPARAPAPPNNAAASPMDRVAECRTVAGGEAERNNCIIRALEGRARTEQELRLLAAAYQVAGRRADAIRTMRVYLQRYPTGSSAPMYQRYVERNG